MKKLVALLLIALLIFGFAAAFAEDTITEEEKEAFEEEQESVDSPMLQANYGVLLEALDAMDMNYEPNADESTVYLGFSIDGRANHVDVFGFAWDVAVEFDAEFPDEIPLDRMDEICKLTAYLNDKIWFGHFEPSWTRLRLEFNAMIYSGYSQPADVDAVEDALIEVVTEAEAYCDVIYSVMMDGVSAEDAIASLENIAE